MTSIAELKDAIKDVQLTAMLEMLVTEYGIALEDIKTFDANNGVTIEFKVDHNTFFVTPPQVHIR